MKLIAVFILFLLMICFSRSTEAQQLMTLEDAISIGLKNNYDILMAKNQEDAAALDYQYAYGAFLPVINGSASRTWSTANISQKYSNGNDVERNGSKSNNISLSADLNWTLFDGLRVFATKDKLKAIQEAGTFTVKDQVVNTVAEIIQAYYNIVQAKQQLQSVAEQMSISEERVNIAKNKYTSGLGSKIDLLQAQVDLNAQKSAYLLQQTLIDESKATLNQLIALPPDNAYSVSDTIPVNLNLDFAALKQQAFSSNPELLLAQKNIDISQLSLKEIQRSRLPVISFNSSYAYTKQSSEAGFSLFNKNKGLSYGFSAAIPIFQGFNINRQAKSAELDIAYQQLNLQNQQSQVSLQLQNAFKDYSYYKKAMQLEEENLGVAEENVKVTLAAFKQGQVSSLEIKEAQQSLADAHYRLISARYNAKLAETNLLRLKGDILK
jgi:outer membrane protein TolC